MFSPWRPSLLALAGLLLALVLGSPWVIGLRFNLTPSAPSGFYSPAEKSPATGDWVELCLPDPIRSFGRARGYHPSKLAAGCEGGAAQTLKRLAALPGDRVEVTRWGLRVNSQLLPNTAPLPLDSVGRPLPNLIGYREVVPPGRAWLYSDHVPNSWDSRYYGSVPLSAIKTAMRPLWVF